MVFERKASVLSCVLSAGRPEVPEEHALCKEAQQDGSSDCEEGCAVDGGVDEGAGVVQHGARRTGETSERLVVAE